MKVRVGRRPWRRRTFFTVILVLFLLGAVGFGKERFFKTQDSLWWQKTVWKIGEYLVESLWNQANPVLMSNTLPEKRKPEDLYGDIDPAYRLYCQEQEFLKEHPYLLGKKEAERIETPEESGAGEETTPETLSPNDDQSQAVPALAGTLSRPITGNTYVLEQLMDYDFLMQHFYSVHTSTTAGRDLMDAKKFLSKDFSIDKSREGPQILIYHTHSQEAFADSKEGENVVGVGAYLSELLKEKGYQVYHDTSVYDLKNGALDRSKAYNYALEGITAILEKYPSIQVVLDIHRDGVAENLHLVTEIDGKPTARIMFFNGLSQTPEGPIDYLKNPYREDNLAFSLQLQLGAEAYFPGYTRKIYLKGLRYNEHLRPRSLLVETGAQTNTYKEALNAMEPLAQLLDMVLQGNQKNSIIQ